jgi:hypothetical protein
MAAYAVWKFPTAEGAETAAVPVEVAVAPAHASAGA